MLNIKIEKKKKFTENNNDKLFYFLTLLQKNINLQNFKYLSYAKKADQTVILTQMDDSEIKAIKQKQKMSMSSEVQNDKQLQKSTNFVTSKKPKEIKPKLGEASTVLIALIDRIRMLDNDIIRLKSKVNTVIEYREREKLLGGKKTAPKQKS